MADKQPVLKGGHSDKSVCSTARCGFFLPNRRDPEPKTNAVDETVCRPVCKSAQAFNSLHRGLTQRQPCTVVFQLTELPN